MSTWVYVALGLLLLGVGLFFLPLRVRFSLQGRGEPNGFWALAGGAQLGPVATSGVMAQGVEAQLSVHVFGKRLWGKKLAELASPRAEDNVTDDREAEATGALERARARYAHLERWLDPVDLFLFVTRERRRVELGPTQLDLEYGFRDITLTGKLLGAIYAFAPLLPDAIVIRQYPSWESVDRGSVAGSGSVRLWPGLLFVDAAWYLIRNVKIRQPRAGKGA
ncbi:MAG: hypothetical protein IPI67_18500 [Myxococcales bacterium]|nr:hypothetical protein [Myxococcales bacterium]